MAVSGSYDFTVTRDTIITDALENLGVGVIGATAKAAHVTSAAFSLNLSIKAMQNRGLLLHSWREAVLFPIYAEPTHNLGPTAGTSHATESHVSTTTTAAAALGASTITAASITGISAADKIGVELDSGVRQWTTVNGAPAGSTVTLTATLTGAAASGSTVFTYTAKIQRPLQIKDAFIRTIALNDIPVDIISISEYRSLTSKTSTGRILKVAFDPQLTDAKLYVWPTAVEVSDRLYFMYKKPVDDFDSTSDNAAFPQDWHDFLVKDLTHRLSSKFSRPLQERLYWLAESQKAWLDLFDDEFPGISFAPNLHY